MSKSSRTVCIVGGGIGGLVCAQSILQLSKVAGGELNVVLLERTARLGGQIKSKSVLLNEGTVLIEEGAEGFVTRSEVFPRVARMAGMPVDTIVDQIRLADNELGYDPETRKWRVGQLPPGVAAQKLGFQVPDRDRGRGIRSFDLGMSQLVDKIGQNLPDVRFNSDVVSVCNSEGGFSVELRSSEGTLSTLRTDAVVMGIPVSQLQSVWGFHDLPQPSVSPQHNSHVSVHLLVPKSPHVPEPSSFTVPLALQDRFDGLRAVAYVNEKFPRRCPDNSWLFRFYYRPGPNEDLNDSDRWIFAAKETLLEVYGLERSTWSHFSPWSQALPIITKDYLESCRIWKDEIDRKSEGRVAIVGSEVAGAGLEAAAMSGYEAAKKIFNRVSV